MPDAPVEPLAFWIPVLAAGLLAGLAAMFLMGGRRPQAAGRKPARRAWLLGLPFLLVFAYRGGALFAWSGTDAYLARSSGALGVLAASALLIGWLGAKRFRTGLAMGLELFTLVAGFVLVTGNRTFLLENSGYDFQALLPGAVVAAFALTERDAWKRSAGWLALATFGVTLVFVATEPVVGGALVLLVATLAACATTWKAGKGHAGPYFAFLPSAVVALVLLAGFSFTGGAPNTTAPAGSTAAPSDLSGFDVREKIWLSLSPIANGQVEAFGTGQFRAAYPPLRDPDELAMTTANHTAAFISEVEHPHNDTLLVLAENGRSAALLWVLGGLGLGGLVLRALLAARADAGAPARASSAPASKAAIAAVAGALWLAGGFHAPFFANPLAALLGGLALGATLPRAPRLVLHVAGPAALLALVSVLTWSWQCIATPEELVTGDVEAAELGQRAPFAELPMAWNASDRGHLDPDLAAHVARLFAAEGRPALAPAGQWWELVLRARPHSLEALIGLGLEALEVGEWRVASQAWTRALAVDPAYPPLQSNLERLAADLIALGHLEPALETLAALVAATTEEREGVLAFDAHDPAHLAALAMQNGEFAAEWRAAAMWLTARKRFAEGGAAAARKELENAATELALQGPPSGPLLVELAVYRSLAGDVLGARGEVAHVPRADYDLWLAELPDKLHTPGKLIAPK